MFLDEARIRVRSGKGGDGCVSFRREKFVPKGGPNGGDGGRGGSVWIRANGNLSTLIDIGRRRLYAASDGRPGMGNNRYGKRGGDLTIDVPVGTTVREVVEDREPRDGRLLGDLVADRARLLAAQGGRGGKGNKAFASATRQVPRIAQKGKPGEERDLYLELRLLADVGLVGLPNAGKSTLLSRISAATPKIASYPFTTLRPNLGIAEVGDYRTLVFADIPGLIEGAHRGQGLGIEFLRHIERTRVLIHLLALEELDLERLVATYSTVEGELASYSEELGRKRRLVVLSKSDLVPPDTAAELARSLGQRLGLPVQTMSGVTGDGVAALLAGAVELVDAQRGDAERACASSEGDGDDLR